MQIYEIFTIKLIKFYHVDDQRRHVQFWNQNVGIGYKYNAFRPPLDKPFDLNKKELLRKAEYQLDDLKKQYTELVENPVLNSIGEENTGDDPTIDQLKKMINGNFK